MLKSIIVVMAKEDLRSNVQQEIKWARDMIIAEARRRSEIANARHAQLGSAYLDGADADDLKIMLLNDELFALENLANFSEVITSKWN